MQGRRPRARLAARGNPARERARQERLQEPRRSERAAEEMPRGQRALEEPAPQPIPGRAPDAFLDERAADVDEPSILHARGTRGLARTAGEAAIQVQL